MEFPKRQILAYFKEGGQLTVYKALRKFRTTELRKIVSRLIKEGHPIQKRWVTDTTTPDGRPTPHIIYFMNTTEIE